MNVLRRFMKRLASSLLPKRDGERIQEELAEHLALLTEEYVRSGLPPIEAHRRARLKLGAADATTEMYRDTQRLRPLENTWLDLRYAMRLFRRQPGFAATVVLTLSLGIGANSTIFSLVDAVLLRKLPVSRPEQLVLIEQGMARGGTQNISRPLFEQLREERRVFSGVFAAQDGITTVPVDSQSAKVQAVSGEYFQVLGTSALLGRTLTSDDDRTPGAHPVAVVSHAFWTRQLGADQQVLGRALTLGGQAFTIVGVTVPNFFGDAVGRAPEVWVPMMMHPTINPGPSLLAEPRTGWLTVVGRLQPGITHEQAESALSLLLGRLKSNPTLLGGMPRHIGKLRVVDGSQGLTRLREQFSLPLRILAVAVGVVLLIACANVATMQLARASTRRREMAIRVSIGAGRRRLVQQLMTESLLLAMIGGALGLLFSSWGTRLLVLMAGTQGQPIDIDVSLSARLIAFNTLVTCGVVLLCGLAPALSASRQDLSGRLKQQPRGRLHLSPMLVVVQVALALPLIGSAALFLQTLHNLRTRDLGFAAETLVQVRTQPEASGYRGEQLPQLAQRIVERLRATPGVRAVSVATSGFATGTSSTCCIAIPGRAFESVNDREVRTVGVGSGYFATVGQHLRLGRDFTPQDASAESIGPQRVAIVNEAFIRAFFGDGSPIGKQFGWGDPPRVKYNIEIVGVVNDAIYDEVRGTNRPLIYFPSDAGRLYVVRAAGTVTDLPSVLRREIQGFDRKLIVTDIAPISQEIERALTREKLLARLSSGFGVLAAALAAIGLYGLMAYAVANRTRDIGICMALGASRNGVLLAEVWSAIRLVGAGIAIGIPAAIVGGRVIAAQFFGVSAGDPRTLAAVATLLVILACLAAYGPARRASRVNPIVVLKNP